MLSSYLIAEAYGRIRGIVHVVLEDADEQLLTFRPDPEANSIAWLIWHLSRVQDDHLSEIMNEEQLWESADWADRFALPFDRAATGHGQPVRRLGRCAPMHPFWLDISTPCTHAPSPGFRGSPR